MNHRYSEYAQRINLDALYEELGFEVLDSRGDEDQGYCILPWDMHKNGDTTGKLGINREKRVFNCFICGGGSLLSLVMAVKDMDMPSSTDWLHQFASEDIITNDDFLADIEDMLAAPELRMDAALPYFNVKVLEKWDQTHDWFAERGISEAVRAEYKLGYGESIRKPAPRKTGDPDYEGPAIVLPVFWKGKLVGWQNRWLDDERPRWVPKYTMTHDFPKKEVLFGYDTAKAPLIIVESVPSALFAISNGYSAVATFGSSVSDTQIRLLRKFTEVVLCPDNDSAGEKWLSRIQTELERYTTLSLILPPEIEGGDLGDLTIKELHDRYINRSQML